MKELWLNFKDENGEAKRVLVEGEKFAIGRTPDNDLQIPIESLSRQHAKIERFADVFIVSDCGSSNGTTLNNEPLEDPVALKHGDILNLGDALEMEVEIPSDKKNDEDEKDELSAAPSFDDESESAGVAIGSTGSAKSSTASAGGGSSSSLWLLMLAPIFMVLILLGLGGAILIARNQKDREIAKNDNTFIGSKGDDDFPENGDNKTPEKDETSTPTPTPVTSPTTDSGGNSTPANSTPVNSSPDPLDDDPTPSKTSLEKEKIKFASAAFLRKIALNDPKTFLLDKYILVLSGEINQFKGSSALAENIKNAKKNASQIKTMAESRNLKTEFLATAALTKLGKQKGDVVATASEMLESLSNITKSFGYESADECLLVMAAYSNNTSGESLQSTAGSFTKQNPNLARSIRSIWFFKENGKLTNQQFDFALQYLAIGTITQNPKDFNVSAEALVF